MKKKKHNERYSREYILYVLYISLIFSILLTIVDFLIMLRIFGNPHKLIIRFDEAPIEPYIINLSFAVFFTACIINLKRSMKHDDKSDDNGEDEDSGEESESNEEPLL